RHDAKRKDRHALNSTAGKHVEEAENAASLATERLRIGLRVEARKRNVGPETVDEKSSERKPQPLLEIFRLREGRKIEIGGKLFRCRSHAFLRLTNSGSGETRIRQAVQIQFQKTGVDRGCKRCLTLFSGWLR